MNRPVKVALAVVVLAVVLAILGAVAPYYTTIVVWELRAMLPALAAIGLAVAVTGASFVAGAALSGRSNIPVIALTTLGLLIGGTLGFFWAAHTYYSQDRTYAASIEIVTRALPGLAGRAPYQVGVAQARPNLGDTTGDISDTTYLPDLDRYATLVNRRGIFSGYEVAFTQQIPLQGRGSADQKCHFDTSRATDRVGGLFSHNLGREISSRKRWVRFSDSDVYAYCDQDTPMVVVPLKRQVGVWVVTEKPAGVAVYNGKTGALTFTTDTRDLPGPSYPLSLAAEQREATAGLGSFWDWLAGRAGWRTPDDATNSGNDSEFALASDGQPMYVTPLTGRGSATAISVVTVVPARHSGTQLAPLTVHKLDPVWVSPQAIVDRIKADYQDIPNWQTINVYEVVPTGGNSWVATLGTGQNILYRAAGTGDLKGEKPTCLQRADGSVYRCGTLAGVDGRGVGTQYGSDGEPGSPPPTGDLRGLTDEQLTELQRRVADEIACRLTKTCPTG
ncbi:MAG TPA: hypothetical protein VFX61_05730 [Micromonosporaceae bacterium]|nr:hypothetical protein [Micromonosporaceae bacterium]